ncbi:MAG: pectate lyase [Prevotella sp.]|nr:pectate lyase [Prevotella sp.]
MKNGSSDIYYATVANISFAKKVEEESGGTVSGSLTITEAKGWYESAYVKFTPVSGASYYNVYVKGGQYSSYTKIDDELVRNYGTYGRADAVGLRAGTYSIKVVAVSGNTETSTYGEATGLTVKNYSREGFAHKGYSGVGAYNDDGTLKSGARVIYITKNTAKTVSCDIVTSSKGATTHYTGWQAILGGYEKGYESTPTTFRIIGTIDKADLDGINSSEEGLQIKGKGYTTVNITIEGIGDDANTRGFGFLIRGCTSVELRNFANMLCMDDAVSMNTDNSHIWVHNLDLFYGAAGSAADQVKGDGTVDLKDDTQWITIDHNHFWDNGKSSLCGMKSESGPNYITYHHNWFDHSDSRHPRIRTMSVHIWNNYFDGNSKYGVGATYGCSAFVDRNYFRNCKIPMMSSKQGTDAKGAGTFSGENGGMIKSYGNVRTGSSANNYIPHTSNSTSFDAYEASSPTEQVPSSYKTVQGGTTYDNFDTNSSVMYSYTPDSANDIPTIIKGDWGAGRMSHGDFSWTFNNSTEDTNYSIITELKSALSSYATKLVGWFK